MDRVSTDFTLHVFRDPKHIRITFPNDRTIAPSAGGIRDKQQTTGVGRRWLLELLQSAQRACQSTAADRGGEQSRPSPSPLRCSRYAARLPHIEADVEQRPEALRCAWSKDSCLSDCLADVSVSVNVGMHGTCMVRRWR